MRIPRRFKIGKQQYKVEEVRTIPPASMGRFCSTTHRVLIATNSALNDREFTKEECLDTFFHEVTHAILKDMGHRLWTNERFVKAFSQRLTQVVLTAQE